MFPLSIAITLLRSWEFPILVPGEFVNIPEGSGGLGVMHSTRIFIREEYLKALTAWDKSEGGFVLVGSSGIGKSTFGQLVFCREMSKNENVIRVTRSQSGGVTILIYEGQVVTEMHSIVDLDFREPSIADSVVIYDHMEGFQVIFGDRKFKKVLIIHSPSAKISNSQKAPNVLFHSWTMNPFGFEEAKVAFPKEAMIEEKFAVCGGLLRHLEGELPNIILNIDEGCNKLTGVFSDNMVGPSGALISGEDGKLCHRVLHMHRLPEDRGYFLNFGSKYIEDKVLKIIASKDETRLLKLANEVDINGSLRGQIFENRMHFSFSSGFKKLEFACRSLSLLPAPEENILLNIADFKLFDSLDQIKQEEMTVSF